jgi:hypothetical protein
MLLTHCPAEVSSTPNPLPHTLQLPLLSGLILAEPNGHASHTLVPSGLAMEKVFPGQGGQNKGEGALVIFP